MRLVIGGYAQGKLNYVLEKYGVEACKVFDGKIPEKPEQEKEIIVINNFHSLVRRSMNHNGSPEKEILRFVEKCQDCVIISDEVGNGIVPTDAFEREYRERTGRILVELAARAEEVERVICGIGQKIK